MTSTRDPILAVLGRLISTPITLRLKWPLSTSKEMCSLPNLISSSCLPSLFFTGHFESSSLYRRELNALVELVDNVLHDLALFDDTLDLADQK